MNRAWIGAGLGGAALLATGPARADIMHWYWEVEVNGQVVDDSKPVPVEAGDFVDINLWADFDPYREGFAASYFAISTSDEFFLAGTVLTEPAEGFGLNGYLLDLGVNGAPADSDGSEVFDMIDGIIPFQLPRAFNSAFDRSDPIRVYRIGWELGGTPDTLVSLGRVPMLDGTFESYVWGQTWGDWILYEELTDSLAFVPAPQTSAALAFLFVAMSPRRRAPAVGAPRRASP